MRKQCIGCWQHSGHRRQRNPNQCHIHSRLTLLSELFFEHRQTNTHTHTDRYPFIYIDY